MLEGIIYQKDAFITLIDWLNFSILSSKQVYKWRHKGYDKNWRNEAVYAYEYFELQNIKD